MVEEAETEADTCRRSVTPRLQAAGWDSHPHRLQEQRIITPGRILFTRGGTRRGEARRLDYLLVLDNGAIHTSRASARALAARPWLTIEWLPKYAPELNDIERSWRDLKRHHLAHRTFATVAHLDTDIHAAVAAMNQERAPLTWSELRMAAWRAQRVRRRTRHQSDGGGVPIHPRK